MSGRLSLKRVLSDPQIAGNRTVGEKRREERSERARTNLLSSRATSLLTVGVRAATGTVRVRAHRMACSGARVRTLRHCGFRSLAPRKNKRAGAPEKGGKMTSGRGSSAVVCCQFGAMSRQAHTCPGYWCVSDGRNSPYRWTSYGVRRLHANYEGRCLQRGGTRLLSVRCSHNAEKARRQ